MKFLVTGSSGHLGEAIVRALREAGEDVSGADLLPSGTTTFVGSVTDWEFVKKCLAGVQAVIHTATLHKPHVATHTRQDFVNANITGSLNLLEEAVAQKVAAFVYTSTTSVFGHALVPTVGEPAAWITEDVAPVPKNIYGVSKFAAENMCEFFSRKFGLPTLILRTSRFFPEEDDNKTIRASYEDQNAKANEFLFRRVDISDVVSAHLAAVSRAEIIGFGRYIISATTPFKAADLAGLRRDAPAVLSNHHPGFEVEYRRRNWRMVPAIDRVYVNEAARRDLG